MTGTTALLLLDPMERLVERFRDRPAIVTAWMAAREVADREGHPVIYVRIAFRPGYPEVHADNRLLSPLVSAGALSEADPSTAIASIIAPRGDEVTVTKRRVSAFSGSDLDVILRSMGVDELVLAGLVTSGVVLSTLVDAVDRDYRISVLSDGCADGDDQLHDALMERYFPTRAQVLTSQQWAG